LIDGHDHEGSSFWVAGDDHQAIFSFIGASVGNIINFKSMFPDSTQFILDLNYGARHKYYPPART
jgi:DNA helicase II / ATP-dependent DNA helicase PcrA